MKASEILQMAIDKGYYNGCNSGSQTEYMCNSVTFMCRDRLISDDQCEEVLNIIASLLDVDHITLVGHLANKRDVLFKDITPEEGLAFYAELIETLKEAGN